MISRAKSLALPILIALALITNGGVRVAFAEEALGTRIKRLFEPTPPPKKRKASTKKRPSPTPSPSASLSSSPKKKSTPAPDASPSPTPKSASAKKSPTPSPSPEASETPTPKPESPSSTPLKSSKKKKPSPTPSPTASPEASATPKPKSSPSASPKGKHAKKTSPTPSPSPETSPSPSASPAVTPTPESSASPSPNEKKDRPSGVAISTNELAGFDQYPPAVQKLIQSSLNLAARNLTYKYGSADPANGGLDCSGFVYYVLRESGLTDVPRDSSEQYVWVRKAGKFEAVVGKSDDTFELANLKPGDLLFWTGTYEINRDPPITHAMIYLGREKSTGRRVMVGASDGRTYHDQSRYGVSVFDFRVSRAGKAVPNGRTPDFVGYGRVPGL